MPDAVDEMDLDRADDLIVYWQDYPPPHLLVRGAVGYKGKPSTDDEPLPPGAL